MTNFPSSFYKGLGNGEFERFPIWVTSSNDYQHMIFEDLDGDGDIDLLWGFNIFLNDGAQNLEPFVDSFVSSAAHKNVAADLFGDSRLEVLAFTSSYTPALVLKYSSDTLLDQQIVLIPTSINPSAFWLMDLNDDGNQDVLYKASNKLGHVMNLGNGLFAPYTLLNEGNNVVLSVLERFDFDNDGLSDIVYRHTNKVGWLKNMGGGSYANAVDITTDFTATSSSDPVLMHSCDCDEDGLNELYFNGGSGKMYKLYQNGAAGFEQDHIFTLYGLDRMYFADIDGDGDIDMLPFNAAGYFVSMNEAGTFTTPMSMNNHLPSQSYSRDFPSELTDLTGDGFVDLPIWVHQQWNYNYGEHTRAIAKGPLFNELYSLVPSTSNREQTGTHFKDFAFGDVDGDGLNEMIVAASNEYSYILHQDNSGTYNFNRRQMIPSLDFGKFCNQVKLVDLNGDGLLDVVSRYPDANTNFGTSPCNVSFQDENGNFKKEVGAFYAPAVFHLVDFNNDGYPDLNYRSSYSANNGNGTFGTNYNLNSGVDFFVGISAVGDFNNDGLLEVVYSSKYPNQAGIEYCMNQGDMIFAPAVGISIPGSGSGQETLSVGDLNGDGFDDIIVDDVEGEKLFMIPSGGDGTFGEAIEIFQGNKCAMRGVADWDGDDDLDLFLTSFANAPEDSVIVILNDGTGNFTLGDALTSFRLDYEFQLKDVNGDGRLEVVEVDFSDEDDGLDDNDDIQEYVRVHFSGIEIFGCTDQTACNYIAEANNDDGSCCETGCGCTDVNACNYNDLASCNDGSCIYPGCSDETACNYVLNAGCEGECFYVYNDCGLCDGTEGLPGCMDVNACNYNPLATCETFCSYPGCNDPEACNYYALAGCDGGNCLYQATITGHVFMDVNGNGSYNVSNMFNSDIGLFNWQVTIEELGWVGYTNNSGAFYFGSVPYGTYTVSILNIEEGWDASNAISQTIVVDACPNVVINFLFEPDEYLPYWLMHDIQMNTNIDCFNGLSPGLHIHNAGNTALQGTITLSFDPILDVSIFGGAVVAPTTIQPGLLTWEVNEDLLPGQAFSYRAKLEGPGPGFIGQSFPMELDVSLFNDELGEYYSETWTSNPIVTCSYDPNDKFTDFAGYTDEHHFILREDDLTYNIRFQNTGNAPANDVIIRDTLDVEHLDLTSFLPLYGSHEFTTTISPEGVVAFQFININLPDSICCPIESQGFVAYKIKPREDANGGDVITNNAFIYFDENPPIETNTTWHTIFDCVDELAAFSMNDSTLCAGDTVIFENSAEFIENYTWTINGVQTEGDSLFELIVGPEIYTVELQVSNPICAVSKSAAFEVIEVIIDAGEDVSICEGEDVMLYAESAFPILWSNGESEESIIVSPLETSTYTVTTGDTQGCEGMDEVVVSVYEYPESSFIINGNLLTASDGSLYQWLLNGELIPSATSQSYEIEEDGDYSVLISNEFGCETLSEALFATYTSVSEIDNQSIGVFPNPAGSAVTLSIPYSKSSVQIFNNTGQLVFEQLVVYGPLQLKVASWASGIYEVLVRTTEGLVLTEKLMVERE